MDVTVSTGRQPLHSGMWGGPVPDPVIALSRMIASLTDGRGRIAIAGINADVRPMAATEKKHLRSLRYTPKDLRHQAGPSALAENTAKPGNRPRPHIQRQ